LTINHYSINRYLKMPLLHYLDQGDPSARSLVILHGLFGTLDNWQTLARRWAEEAGLRVVSVDLRNHGRSFHSPEHSYALMAQDVLALFDHLALDPAHLTLMGHSMGGKVAMTLALGYPTRLAQLIVADIAPRFSNMEHQDDIIAGLQAVDLSTIQTRQQAEAALARTIPQPGVRQFLLKNLYRREDNSFALKTWRPWARKSTQRSPSSSPRCLCAAASPIISRPKTSLPAFRPSSPTRR
jgi:esterase